MLDRIIRRMIVRSGRSWWQARYFGGKELSEWDTVRGVSLPRKSTGRTSRWEDIPKENMLGLRLFCPDGNCAVLEASEGRKFFQLKVGEYRLGGGQQKSSVLAQIIGVVLDDTGRCECYAWEPSRGRINHFFDNVQCMRYQGIGPLNLDVQGLRV